jgi:acetyl esterase/lipase
MKTLFTSAILFSSLILSRAEMQTSIPLWPDGAPGALGTNANDIPTLTPYFPGPTNATGAAMIICPGGGYQHLAPHEGNDYALWLNQHGVTCFVLKYRLGPKYHHPAMLEDAARAMRQSSRPDIGILCYALISLGEFAHKGSRDNLLGKNPSPELVENLSNELQATTNTPPCFLWCTFEDKTVPMENTLLFAAALRKNHVPFDLHIYQKGGHGLGLGDRTPPLTHPHPWTGDCLFWLKAQGFVK